MFHQGDLQSGISLAIQQRKLVACLVRQDDDPLSTQWETEWLSIAPKGEREPGMTMANLVDEKAVLLRITAGTQEAGFLSAFCSLENVPKFILIDNGRVVEDLDNTVSEQDFILRILNRLGFDSRGDELAADVPEISAAHQHNSSPSVAPELSTATPVVTAPPSVAPVPAQTPAPIPANTRIQDLLSERGARLEADRKAQREDERKAQREVARQRREEAENAKTEAGAAQSARQNWIEQQRTRQQEAKLERERILKTIESDKRARRQREEQRRLIAQAEAQGIPLESVASPSSAATVQQPQSSTRATETCSLQIRLFDGTSLRTRFHSSATLSAAVRTYVAQESSSDIPYNFRLMQTPLPSRNIDISEESETLLSLGLCPSATLVLVPVTGFTEAYATSGPTGLLSRGLSFGYSAVTGVLGFAGGVVGRAVGYGGDGLVERPFVAGTADEAGPSNTEGINVTEGGVARITGDGVKIRTLADQRRRAQDEGTELYNGNQLNFEPRKKDDEDKE